MPIAKFVSPFAVASLLLLAATGCQSMIAEKPALPSRGFESEDIEYYPAGPEFKLTNQVEAIEQYNREQAAIEDLENDERMHAPFAETTHFRSKTSPSPEPME